jgi:hypothetical protein
MLPIPPGCQTDDQYAQRGDGTTANDGWAAFSGTSAAAPQLAGICALMKQIDPSLSPERIASILEDTATDVTLESKAYPRHQVAIGHDIHTGYGLANAWEAIQAIQPNVTENPPPIATPASTPPVITQEVGLEPSSVTLFSSPSEPTVSNTVLSKRKPKMSADYPKLREKLDEIRNEFDAILKRKIDAGEIEEVQLSLSEHDFSSRSPRTDSILALVACVQEIDRSLNHEPKDDDLEKAKERVVENILLGVKAELDAENLKNTGDKETLKAALHTLVEPAKRKSSPKIRKQHIYAAKSLLKVKEYEKLATRVLIAAMNSGNAKISEMATEALGELSEENISFRIVDIASATDPNFLLLEEVDAMISDDQTTEPKKVTAIKDGGDDQPPIAVSYNGNRYLCKNKDKRTGIYYNCHNS